MPETRPRSVPRNDGRLIDLAKNAVDERVRSVCLIAVLDRAGVRPIDYIPAEDAAAGRTRFDPSLYTPEQLVEIEKVLRMVDRRDATGGSRERPLMRS